MTIYDLVLVLERNNRYEKSKNANPLWSKGFRGCASLFLKSTRLLEPLLNKPLRYLAENSVLSCGEPHRSFYESDKRKIRA